MVKEVYCFTVSLNMIIDVQAEDETEALLKAKEEFFKRIEEEKADLELEYYLEDIVGEDDE